DSVEDIERAEEEYRDRDAERLAVQKEKNDFRAARDRMITQMTRD
ncbi:MAG: hypothetical protein JJ925_18280, partial [Parvibaculum sp.]|nr:hypothetical protein [Parvibaculum sp.]